MDYKTALGKSFIDPQDLRPTRLDLATIDIEALHVVAEAMVRSSDFTPADGDMIAKVAHVLQRVKADLDVTDLKGLGVESR